MREIKYKAWDKKTKRVAEVVAIVFSDISIEDDCDSKLGSPVIDAGVWICTDKDCLFEECREFNQVELMEYTGKKDKDGNEIYESYFLKYDNPEYSLASGIYLVSRSEEDVGFLCEREEPYNYLLPNVWCECEIIGTKYENKGMRYHQSNTIR